MKINASWKIFKFLCVSTCFVFVSQYNNPFVLFLRQEISFMVRFNDEDPLLVEISICVLYSNKVWI